MEKVPLKETIKNITRLHLSKGNPLFGQCITAVGWVGGTIPEDGENLTELPMADVMNGGVVVGSALAGKRPIYVVRYQGFQWFNYSIIANYAGRSAALWKINCPIFIRSIAMEGGIGPVAGSSHHGLAFRMPGVKICAPMTSREYTEIYNTFMQDECPYYVSEHRVSHSFTGSLVDIEVENPDWVLFPYSVTRFAAKEAAEERGGVSVYHQVWIRPLGISERQIEKLKKSKYGGVVIDDDYPNGIAKQIAHDLMLKSGKKVYVLALNEVVAGFQPHNDNLPPDKNDILSFLKSNE
tara:strand:+ start:602 stop:1486 length:885 start_codon:yes stop_codon:yes gene_type:complete